jgi:hypothetical protein
MVLAFELPVGLVFLAFELPVGSLGFDRKRSRAAWCVWPLNRQWVWFFWPLNCQSGSVRPSRHRCLSVFLLQV